MVQSVRRLALVIGAAGLLVSGCARECNCPDPVYGKVVVPADTSRPLGVVTVEELECIASDSGAVTGGRLVTVSRSAPGTCHVRAELWNGAGAYTFTVEFQSPGGCCSYLANAVSMSTPQPAAAASGSI